jgi:bacillithiol biosynthesis cysteine-adding enzyme BshC
LAELPESMQVNISQSPLHTSGLVNNLVRDYLNADDFLSDLFTHKPYESSVLEWIDARKDFPHEKRLLLKNTLASQYKKCGLYSDEIERRITLLEQSNTYTICTGQQVGLLLGPMYTTLKILSAVSLCDELTKRHPDKNFIPVFWMAGEDHDLSEIQSAFVGSKSYTWETNQTGPCGRMKTAGINELIRSIPELQYRPELLKILYDAYDQENLAEATLHLCNALFGSMGLLVINPDDAGLKKSFAQIMLHDITEQNSFRESRKAISHLEKRYKIQLNGRPINFFYQSNRNRERIEATADGFTTESGSYQWTKEELDVAIQANPDAFSPNAMMRPLYQEFVLPNLAYFGGAAELAYWLELKPVFDFYNIPYPAVLLRNSAFALDAVNMHRCKNAGLVAFDLIRPLAELEQALVLREMPHDILLREEYELLDKIRALLATKSDSIGSGMPEAAQAFTKGTENELVRLQKKFLREAKRNESNGLKQLRLARAEAYPGEVFQERRENLFGFLMKSPGLTFLTTLAEKQAPFGNALLCVTLDV